MRHLAIAAVWLFTLNAGATSTNQVPIPPDLAEEVLTHHLKKHPPRQQFGLVGRIDWDRREFVDLPADVLGRIVRHTVGGKRQSQRGRFQN